MDIELVKNAPTREEAIDYAIEWQTWSSNVSMSWSEVYDWQEVFEMLANKFDLVEEFKENLII